MTRFTAAIAAYRARKYANDDDLRAIDNVVRPDGVISALVDEVLTLRNVARAIAAIDRAHGYASDDWKRLRILLAESSRAADHTEEFGEHAATLSDDFVVDREPG